MIVTQIRQRLRKLVDVPGAGNIDLHGDIARHCQVVDRREVKNHCRLGTRCCKVVLRHPEIGLCDVALENAKV